MFGYAQKQKVIYRNKALNKDTETSPSASQPQGKVPSQEICHFQTHTSKLAQVKGSSATLQVSNKHTKNVQIKFN